MALNVFLHFITTATGSLVLIVACVTRLGVLTCLDNICQILDIRKLPTYLGALSAVVSNLVDDETIRQLHVGIGRAG